MLLGSYGEKVVSSTFLTSKGCQHFGLGSFYFSSSSELLLYLSKPAIVGWPSLSHAVPLNVPPFSTLRDP
jgi:hypothetical protein